MRRSRCATLVGRDVLPVGRAGDVLVLGLELRGAKGVRNYYTNWSEWGNATDKPVEVPKK